MASHVYFKPWVGEHYLNGGMFSKRILIMGESHYEWRKENWEQGIPLEQDLTRWCVESQISGEETHRFWTSIAITFLNSPADTKPSVEEKRKFWQSVAFFNFVQECVGFGSGSRPTEKMWEDSYPAFPEVLSDLCPRFIAVFSREAWDHLPEFDDDGPVISNTPDGKPVEMGFYNHPEGRALAFRLIHPSAPFHPFNGRDWHPSLVEALAAAPDN